MLLRIRELKVLVRYIAIFSVALTVIWSPNVVWILDQIGRSSEFGVHPGSIRSMRGTLASFTGGAFLWTLKPLSVLLVSLLAVSGFVRLFYVNRKVALIALAFTLGAFVFCLGAWAVGFSIFSRVGERSIWWNALVLILVAGAITWSFKVGIVSLILLVILSAQGLYNQFASPPQHWDIVTREMYNHLSGKDLIVSFVACTRQKICFGIIWSLLVGVTAFLDTRRTLSL